MADLTSGRAHQIDPRIAARFQGIRDLYFSRHPQDWPCFGEPGFARASAFHASHVAPAALLAACRSGARPAVINGL